MFDFFLYKCFKQVFFKNSAVHISNYFYNEIIFVKNNLSLRFNTFSENKLCIGAINKSKFYWTNFSYNPIKFFSSYKNNFSLTKNNSNPSNPSKLDLISVNIFLKKQSGLIKRKDRLTYNTLVKSNFLKNYKSHNVINDQPAQEFEFSKIFDLKKRTFKFFSLNREVLKNNLLVTNSRQKRLTKFLSKNSKKNTVNLITNFELSLLNILVKSHLVHTTNESIFLIKNNLVYVNGLVNNNPFYCTTRFDIINIVYSTKYFNFFKTSFNSKLKLTFLLGYRLWRFNRFKNNFYKQSPSNLPAWINKLTFFYSDVPSYIEVDYQTLTLTLLNFKISNSLHFIKIINFFSFRLYNWKYLN